MYKPPNRKKHEDEVAQCNSAIASRDSQVVGFSFAPALKYSITCCVEQLNKLYQSLHSKFRNHVYAHGV